MNHRWQVYLSLVTRLGPGGDSVAAHQQRGVSEVVAPLLTVRVLSGEIYWGVGVLLSSVRCRAGCRANDKPSDRPATNPGK